MDFCVEFGSIINVEHRRIFERRYSMSSQVPSASSLSANERPKPSLLWNIAKFMLGALVPPLAFGAWDVWHTVKEADLKIKMARADLPNVGGYAVKRDVRSRNACPVDINTDAEILTADFLERFVVTGKIHVVAHQSATGEGWARYSVIADGKPAGEVPVECPDTSSDGKIERDGVSSPTPKARLNVHRM